MRNWLCLVTFFSCLSWAARPVLKPIHFPFDQLGKTSMKLEPAFQNLRFSQPVFLTPVPGTSNLLAVVELSGKIKIFKDNSDTGQSQLLIDLGEHITVQGEEGLLGLAFSPFFKSDGIFYVYYSPRRRRESEQPTTVLSQFKARLTSSGYESDYSSQIKLLEIPQPEKNHKGGMLAFLGDELYIGVGDGGGWNDRGENRPYDRSSHNNGQNLKTLLGKILRIRPDGKGSYSIPSDNPFIDHAFAKPEIFAFGIRNPWRFSFDRNTGKLWLGDVGQDSSEEITVVEKGDNLGWSIFEGNQRCPGCDPNQTLVGGVHKAPIFAYNHSVGKSITGGYVYRGTELSELYGKYIFADFVAGKVWSLDFENQNSNPKMHELAQSSNIVSLGVNHKDELFIISFRDGILKLKRSDSSQNPSIPKRLSQTGLFQDTKNLIPQSGLSEYEVNSPLWSDGATKRRFIALGNGQFLNFRDKLDWELPNQTVLVKHFELPSSPTSRTKVETRVLIKANERWSAFTYLWNDEQTDAMLVTEGATKDYEVWNPRRNEFFTQKWTVPSQNQCFQCHTQTANVALGISTLQLNKDEQLIHWDDLKLLKGFDASEAKTLAKLVNPYDSKLELASRAKSYLHAQCFHCHMPQGPTPASIDLRYSSRTEDLYRSPSLGDGGLKDPLIVKPGFPDESLLYHRFLRADASTAMPPMGVQIIDQNGADLLKKWIESLRL